MHAFFIKIMSAIWEHANPVEKHASEKAFVNNVNFSDNYEAGVIRRGIDWAIYWCHFQPRSAHRWKVISVCLCYIFPLWMYRASQCEKNMLVKERLARPSASLVTILVWIFQVMTQNVPTKCGRSVWSPNQNWNFVWDPKIYSDLHLQSIPIKYTM